MLVGADTETKLIGPENLAPELVCATQSFTDGNKLHYTDALRYIGVNADRGRTDVYTPDSIIDYWLSPGVTVVFQNAPFDLGVLFRDKPERIEKIFDKLWAGEIKDTKTREKLLHLSDTGNIDYEEVSPGKSKKRSYSLAALVHQYFGIDLSHLKQAEDAWRLNYELLMHVPIEQWPNDAVDYAVSDALYAEYIYYAQEDHNNRLKYERDIDAFKTENFRVLVDFCLHLLSMRGVATDANMIMKLQAEYKEAASAANFPLLVKAGILRPAVPPRPYANGAKDSQGNPKMTEGKKESKSIKKLHKHIIDLTNQYPDMKIKKSKKTGNPSIGDGWLEDNHTRSPELTEFFNLQKLQKMVNTELPRLMWNGRPAKIVHPSFDNLKRTGRTSSFASKLFPSFNCQNVDPKARLCIVPRPGFLMFSIDYSAMELGTLAQKCLDLFGFSVLADLINAGEDPHAYLAAQLAYNIDNWFNEYARYHLRTDDQPNMEQMFEIYKLFSTFKNHENPALVEFFDHWRKYAKPTGLGYPGGLGPDTFITYSKGTFGVIVDVETATRMREIWRMALPEMPLYHQYINENMVDPHNVKVDYVEPTQEELNLNPMASAKPKESKLYCYKTPMGMHRAGADFCAAANGNAMQSPSAEGATLGLAYVQRESWDASRGSILCGNLFANMFIHDEITGDVVENLEIARPALKRCAILMEQAMSAITPDVKARTETTLMRRWNKKAKPVYDEAGNLMVWEEK